MSQQHFKSFSEFYVFYLSEHKKLATRRCHFFGLLIAISCMTKFLLTFHWIWLLFAIIAGYGFAWLGHLLFEKNRPTTFRYPFYSFLADWKMLKDICLGRIPL